MTRAHTKKSWRYGLRPDLIRWVSGIRKSDSEWVRALQIADELRAYTLTDKGTWLALQERLSLPVHVAGASDGRNVYGIIAVNPERHPQVNFAAAKNLIDWIQSDEAQEIIVGHRVNNEQLFYIIE